jgi:histidinol phosphatase-like enzyme
VKAVFLDRDGVIIQKAPEGEYIARWEQVQFLPGALEGISSLYRAGFKIIVITNQRGVALGKIHLGRSRRDSPPPAGNVWQSRNKHQRDLLLSTRQAR